VNNIEVLPPSPMDDQLRHALYRAIYGDPGLSRTHSGVPSIHIIVKNGNVTLEALSTAKPTRISRACEPIKFPRFLGKEQFGRRGLDHVILRARGAVY